MFIRNLKPGDVLFWRGTSFWAWVVRKWTHSPYGHTGIYVESGIHGFPSINGVVGPCYLDSSPRVGVQIRLLSSNLPDAAIATHTAWTPEYQTKALQYINQPYDFIDAVRAAVGLPARNRGFMCSEFVFKCLEDNGWVWKGITPTPASLAAGLEAATGNKIEPITI